MTGQSSRPRATRSRYVLRDTTPVVAFVLAAAVGAFLVVDTIVVGAYGALLATAPLVGGILGLLWLVLAHPHVAYDGRGVVVTGITRVVSIPWRHVETVRQSVSLDIALDDGRVIRASGVTAPRDRGMVLSVITRGRYGAGAVDAHSNADALRAMRADSLRTSPADEPVTSRWDTVPLVVVGVLTLIAIVDVVVLVVR